MSLFKNHFHDNHRKKLCCETTIVDKPQGWLKIRLSKQKIIFAVIASLSISVVVLSVVISNLNDDIAQRDAQIKTLTLSLDESSSECSSLSAQLEEAESNYQIYRDRFEAERTLYRDLRNVYNDMNRKYTFYYHNAVVKPNDGMRYIHKYGCNLLTTSNGYTIYNTGVAFSKGYHPCPECMDNGYYIGNRNTLVYHKPTCSSLPETANRKYFLFYLDARAAGYRPCGHCHPFG